MRYLFFLVLLFCLFTNCSDDTASASATVEGSWELVRATRNNTETSMLDGLNFHFAPDGKLETNLMGNEVPGTYEWAEEEIITEGVKLPLTYSIQELTDSTLHLRSSYQGFQFDFLLARP
ncbi:MAG: hypothetical protein AAF840_08565 [Bacteroidota bacterium]